MRLAQGNNGDYDKNRRNDPEQIGSGIGTLTYLDHTICCRSDTEACEYRSQYTQTYPGAHFRLGRLSLVGLCQGFGFCHLDLGAMTMCIPQHEGYGTSHQDYPTNRAIFDTGKERQSRHILSNTNGKGIEHCAGETDVCSQVDHTYTHKIVVTERARQGDDHGDKGDGLFAHTKDGTKQTK